MAKPSSVSPITSTGPWVANPPATLARARDWRKRMSDTVAYALLVYTALQIVVTMHAMSTDNASMLPLFALVVLVAGIIPLFRHYERRWEKLDDVAAADAALRPLFRRDQMSVWLFAIGLPFAITGLFRALVSFPG
jgi:hypothetical protein